MKHALEMHTPTDENQNDKPKEKQWKLTATEKCVLIYAAEMSNEKLEKKNCLPNTNKSNVVSECD